MDFPLFADELRDGEPTGRSQLFGRIRFPGKTDAYLHVCDWIVSERGYLRRDYYAYDLILLGARVANWHRHEGMNHIHDDVRRIKVASESVTLQEAVDLAFDRLYPES